MFKILVVEDDKDLNRAVSSFLTQNGYETTGCLNAADAYDAMYEDVFDLVISDIMMPGIDGFEFAKNVRNLDNEIPILFMTARDDMRSMQRGYSIGIDDYMTKPVNFDELLLRIGALLRRARIATSHRLEIGSFTMDLDERTAELDGEEIALTVTRPVRKIRKGLGEITNGDFSVRIEPVGNNAAFDSIIESINRMTEELSSVETLKTDFISNVSHEIKTPIAVINNYGRLLQSDTLTEEQRKEYAMTISNAAMRLDGLIANILKLNRLENQQIRPATERFDLGAHLTECLLSFETVWEEKEIEIEPDIAEDVFVTCDKELLSIVWNNLFSNAFKFTEPGGKVGVTLTCEGEEAVVSVSDTGCGISPEEARHIFDKFYQGDTSRSTQGNGLGLALVKRIIDISDGSVAVDSVPGEGSTFTVRLKRAAA